MDVRDIVQVIVERVEGIIHWYLRHRTGWTLHFNDEFEGAQQIILELQARLGFILPSSQDLAGPGGDGPIVWAEA